MESELLKRLEALGCRTAEALDETYAGNEGFYERMLGKLVDSDCPARLRAAVGSARAADVFAVAHEMKGLYGTMGLTPLHAESSELVEIVRAGSMDGVKERAERLLARHDDFIRRIAAARG